MNKKVYPRVHRLDDASIAAIRSGPIITDLQSVAKELIENAIVSGCTHIKFEIFIVGILCTYPHLRDWICEFTLCIGCTRHLYPSYCECRKVLDDGSR